MKLFSLTFRFALLPFLSSIQNFYASKSGEHSVPATIAGNLTVLPLIKYYECLGAFRNLLVSLQFKEEKVYSQNGEDGITIALLEYIGTTNKFYLEFGVETGEECNSRVLIELYGFHGVLWDGGNHNPRINLNKLEHESLAKT